jgi:hypothetical protein
MRLWKTSKKILAGSLLLAATQAWAGGAWIPEPGDGSIQWGYSRKTADHSWNADGETVSNSSLHDFRYGYLSGEVGLRQRLSGTFVFTYLWGFEGPKGDGARQYKEPFFGLTRSF